MNYIFGLELKCWQLATLEVFKGLSITNANPVKNLDMF